MPSRRNINFPKLLTYLILLILGGLLLAPVITYAALTLDSTSLTSDGALTLNSASSSAINLNSPTVFKNTNDSIIAFQIQNAAGKTVLIADTTGGQIILGNSGASGVTGLVKFNYSGQTGSISLTAANPSSTDYTITLPAETGTVCTTGSVCSGYVPATGAYGYVLTAWHSSFNPADSTTYYWGGSFSGGVGSTPVRNQMYIPKAGTIKRIDLRWSYTDGTAGFNTTVSLRLNNTTDTVLTSTLDLSAFPTVVNATGLSISVVAGDYIEFKYVTPAWAPTNPTGVVSYATIYVE